jgi:hypothetical protein
MAISCSYHFGLLSQYLSQSGMAWSILELGAQVFYTGRCAADGKIYYSVFGSNGFTLSVIHEPDKKGLACNVETTWALFYPP